MAYGFVTITIWSFHCWKHIFHLFQCTHQSTINRIAKMCTQCISHPVFPIFNFFFFFVAVNQMLFWHLSDFVYANLINEPTILNKSNNNLMIHVSFWTRFAARKCIERARCTRQNEFANRTASATITNGMTIWMVWQRRKISRAIWNCLNSVSLSAVYRASRATAVGAQNELIQHSNKRIVIIIRGPSCTSCAFKTSIYCVSLCRSDCCSLLAQRTRRSQEKRISFDAFMSDGV